MLQRTIFNEISLHKKSHVTWRLQTISNATFVVATCCTTLNRLEVLTTLLLQQIDCHVTGIDFSRNNVALKIVPCNITFAMRRVHGNKKLNT